MSRSTAREAGVLVAAAGSLTGPGQAEVVLPGVPAAFAAVSTPVRDLLHELRGSLTALEAYLDVVGEQTPAAALDEGARSCLAGASANAQRLSGLAEALALVVGSGVSRPVPLGRLLGETAQRWKKFLSRHGLTLNLLGELPDRSLDGRCAGVVLGTLLALAAEVLARSGGDLVLSALEGKEELDVTLTLRGPAIESEALAAHLAAACAPGRFAGLALAAALESLPGRLHVEALPEGARAVLRVAAGGAE